MPDVGDHYRPTGDEYAPVYRVVGTTDDVALLRVTNGDGYRTYTGDLRHVSEDVLDANFEPVADPDAGFTPLQYLRNLVSGAYWNLRKFL